MMANRITRPEARVLAEVEFTRFAELVATLTPEEWATPTDCTGWDVRKMVLHVAAVGPRAVKGRWHTPPPARYIPLPFGPPIGWAPLKYLLDVGFTRDVWAHRIDIHAAIGRPMHLTADHDGRLVADIVLEWADIHGQPFELVLDGAAGGKFSQGVDGERVEMDALDFLRALSGRLPGVGVLSHPLPL